MEESMMKCATRGNSSPNGKPRIYFTCHPDDFEKYFQKVTEDIFKSHNPAFYYTPDMTAELDEKNKDADLGRSNLFIIPVTYKLLTTKNRAMDHDFPYALKNNIPVLPLMMEKGLDKIYSAPNKFYNLQYLNPFSTNHTEISYEDKLKKFLDVVLISDEVANRVRKAFDAYIFLSYRKKDRAYANKLIKLIHNNPECRDIAVWFDEFLSPGENFKENIEKILKDSDLFALLVTPNLLEESDGRPNYIMENEYPAALAYGMKILPTEMEETDKDKLSKKFKELPPCVKPETEFEELKELLAKALTLAAKAKNDNDPEHNFLIGLAYLEGIDVEVDKERGLELITSAARAKLPEAMIKLRDMAREKIGTVKNLNTALDWAREIYYYYKSTYGEEHPDTLTSLNIYADICKESGEDRLAFTLSEKAYNLCGKVFGTDHPETLNSLNGFALSSQRAQTFKESIALCNRAYTLCSNTLGKEHPITLTAVNNQATVYYNKGKYHNARKLFEKAYNLRCSILNEEHPDTLRSLDSLADTCGKLRKYKKAISLREKEHNLYCKILGSAHPDTLAKLHNLAQLCGKAAKKSKSIELGKEAYNLRCSYLGADDYDTLKSLSLLSNLYLKSGKFTEASKALAIYTLDSKPLRDELILSKTFDHSALTTQDRAELKALFKLADSHEKSGEYAKSLETYEKAYALSCEILGKVNMFTQIILCIIFFRCWKARKFKKALKIYASLYLSYFKTVAIFSKEFPEFIKKIKMETNTKTKGKRKKK